MTPNHEYVVRSNTKTWLLDHAPPSALEEIFDSLLTANEGLDSLEIKMIQDVYFRLTGNTLEPRS